MDDIEYHKEQIFNRLNPCCNGSSPNGGEGQSESTRYILSQSLL